MRKSFLGLATAFLGGSMIQAVEHAMRMANSRQRINFDRVGPKSTKTGRTYPHSSTRQRARYARQIANGQLRIS